MSIPPLRAPAAMAFMFVWIVPVAILGLAWWPKVVVVLTDEWKQKSFGVGDLFITFVLSGLTWGMLRAIASLAWLLLGREELLMTGGFVQTRKRIGPLA